MLAHAIAFVDFAPMRSLDARGLFQIFRSAKKLEPAFAIVERLQPCELANEVICDLRRVASGSAAETRPSRFVLPRDA